MKRNKNLQPLSRQHHNALMAVLLLKKGIQKKADADVMKDFIFSVWEDELKTHFIEEEKWLLPKEDDTESNLLFEKMLKEHKVLREFILQFQNNNNTVETVEQFYKLLEQHIRFEERIFFAAIEKKYSTIQLEAIGKNLKDINTKSCASFPVKFWV